VKLSKEEFKSKYKKYLDGAEHEKITPQNAKGIFQAIKNNNKKSNKLKTFALQDIEKMIQGGCTFAEALKELKKAWDHATHHSEEVNKSALSAGVAVLLGNAWFALKNDSQGAAIELAKKDGLDMKGDYMTNVHPHLSTGAVIAKLKIGDSCVLGKSHYGGDPFWMTSKYSGKCRKCSSPINKGDNIFYYPKGKTVYCEKCGQGESAKFDSMVEDEDFMNGGGNY